MNINVKVDVEETNITEESSLQPLKTSGHKAAMLGMVVYVFVAAIVLFLTFLYIKNTYDNRAVFRIMRQECILTIVCNLGRIGVMSARLLQASYPILCIPSTALLLLNLSLLTGTRWYISHIR